MGIKLKKNMKIILLTTVIAKLMVMRTASSEEILIDDMIKKSGVLYGMTFKGPALEARRLNPLKDYQPEITDECKRLGYCEHVPNYPNDIVQQLIDDNPNWIFITDQLDNSTMDIVSRVGDPVPKSNQSIVPLCEANEQIIYPQAAQDEGNIWRYVVNPKDKPLQKLRVETCSNTSENQCSDLITVEKGYASQCEQKYQYRTVGSLDEEYGGIINRDLKFPSHCSCVLLEYM